MRLKSKIFVTAFASFLAACGGGGGGGGGGNDSKKEPPAGNPEQTPATPSTGNDLLNKFSSSTNLLVRDNRILAYSTSNSFLFSKDRGTTFEKRELPLSDSSNFNTEFVLSQSFIFARTSIFLESVLFVSKNDGQTFERMALPAGTRDFGLITGLDVSDDALYLAGSNSIFRSTDEGLTWSEVFSSEITIDGMDIVGNDFYVILSQKSGDLSDLFKVQDLADIKTTQPVLENLKIKNKVKNFIQCRGQTCVFKPLELENDGTIHTSTTGGNSWVRVSSIDSKYLMGFGRCGPVFEGVYCQLDADKSAFFDRIDVVVGSDGEFVPAPRGKFFPDDFTPDYRDSFMASQIIGDSIYVLSIGEGLQVSSDGGKTWSSK